MTKMEAGDRTGNLWTLPKEFRAGCPKYATLAYWLIWIKVTQETASAGRILSPSFIPLRAGNKFPMWKIPFLHQKLNRHPYHQRQGVQGWEGCINKPGYFFTNSLPHTQTSLSCQFLTVFFSLYRRYKSCLLWSFLLVLYFYYEIKFVFLLLICFMPL